MKLLLLLFTFFLSFLLSYLLMYLIVYLLAYLLTYSLTAIELSLGGSSSYTSTAKQIRINIHKRNNTKNTTQTSQNTVNTGTYITKTPTHYKTHKYM